MSNKIKGKIHAIFMLHYNFISTFEAVLLTKNYKIEPPDLLFIGLFQKKPNRGGLEVGG